MSGTTQPAAATIGTMAPPAQSQDPMQQQQYQRLASMSAEQLQELVSRLGSSSMGALAQRVLQQKRMGSAQSAPSDGQPQAYALGGLTTKIGPNATRGQFAERAGIHMPSTGHSGFLNTAGPGRTDNLHITPVSGSYVLPADVVSGMGEGNSLAGSKAFQTALSTGPYGAHLPSVGKAHGFGKMPAAPHVSAPLAKGGETPTVPIIAAGGEEVVSPEWIEAIGRHYGGGAKMTAKQAMDHGHAIHDKLSILIRKRTIAEMSKLKGPVGAKP